MTVINNIEIDHIEYHPNDIKDAVRNNAPLDDTLHVVMVVSNPCLFARRYILAKEFMQRMEREESRVALYTVELIYPGQRFLLTKSGHPRHLQLRAPVPLWHKENMVNQAFRRLLPPDWKAAAWIDADVEFDHPHWVNDTLCILNGTKDVVQLFSHCVDMGMRGEAMRVFNGWGFQYTKGLPYTINVDNYWHPGYAWACTRTAYEKMGGLFELGILGSGDNLMAMSFLQKASSVLNDRYDADYVNAVLAFQQRVRGLRIGYVPGVIRHYYHGTKANRRYGDRFKILIEHGYSPARHVTFDQEGVLVPTDAFPSAMGTDIMSYFRERDEDDMYRSAVAGAGPTPPEFVVRGGLGAFFRELANTDCVSVASQDDDATFPVPSAEFMSQVLGHIDVGARLCIVLYALVWAYFQSQMYYVH